MSSPVVGASSGPDGIVVLEFEGSSRVKDSGGVIDIVAVILVFENQARLDLRCVNGNDARWTRG